MSDTPTVTVRYWAAARAAAKTDADVVSATTADAALAAVVNVHDDPRFTRIVEYCSILHNEVQIRTRDLVDVALADGDVLELLPPVAGG